MRLMITAAVAALALVCAGTAADAKGKKAGEKSYTFNVQCPAIAPVPATVGTCSAKGKSADAARATCQTKHNFCYLQTPKKEKKAAKAGKKSKKAKA